MPPTRKCPLSDNLHFCNVELDKWAMNAWALRPHYRKGRGTGVGWQVSQRRSTVQATRVAPSSMPGLLWWCVLTWRPACVMDCSAPRTHGTKGVDKYHVCFFYHHAFCLSLQVKQLFLLLILPFSMKGLKIRQIRSVYFFDIAFLWKKWHFPFHITAPRYLVTFVK